jgi:hypothetical protein
MNPINKIFNLIFGLSILVLVVGLILSFAFWISNKINNK